MSNKFLRATAFALISYGNAFSYAQEAATSPKLVVSITIDQLRTDDIIQSNGNASDNGLKFFFLNGILYNDIKYSFNPTDEAALIASISTGTTPYYNGIIRKIWLDRNTTKEKNCVDDGNYQGVMTDECCSAENILTTTLSDELKYYTKKKGLVYSISPSKEFAILTAGHNANGAYWINEKEGNWCTTTYYEKRLPDWVGKINERQNKREDQNERTTNLAIECIKTNYLGKDDSTDLLYIEYKPDIDSRTSEEKYKRFLTQTDNNISKLLKAISSNVALNDVLFILTGNGQSTQSERHDGLARYPGGKFYINRAADLLNMYLGAIYGSDKYILGFCHNQIYLNTFVIDKKKINTSEISYYSKRFLRQCQGVSNVYYSDDILMQTGSDSSIYKNAYNIKNSGDIIIEILPGWEITNENSKHITPTLFSTSQSPIVIYNNKLGKQRISESTEIGSIIETISKILKIRAPNGCKHM